MCSHNFMFRWFSCFVVLPWISANHWCQGCYTSGSKIVVLVEPSLTMASTKGFSRLPCAEPSEPVTSESPWVSSSYLLMEELPMNWHIQTQQHHPIPILPHNARLTWPRFPWPFFDWTPTRPETEKPVEQRLPLIFAGKPTDGETLLGGLNVKELWPSKVPEFGVAFFGVG